MIVPMREELRQASAFGWATIRYALDSNARTVRLCAIMLARSVPLALLLLAILIRG